MKKTIICVDDEKVILQSLTSQLSNSFEKQYLIETFDNPKEVLEYLEELYAEGGEVAVLISDWLMPQLKGDELLQEVHKLFPDIPAIMLSGQADESAKKRAFETGAMQAFIAKPWMKEQLVLKIRELIK